MTNHTPSSSPAIKGQPLRQSLRWWITPRATERDTRFREGVLRISMLAQLIILIVLVPVITFGRTEEANLITITLMIAATLVVMFLIHIDYIDIAGWALMLMLTALFFYAVINYGLWISMSFIALGVMSVYGQVVLPRDQIRYLLILMIGSIFSTLFIRPTTQLAPEFLANIENFTLPSISIATALVFVISINLMLFVLRREFDARSDELRGFVNELDARVKERTRELEIARQQAEDANKIKSQFLANMSHELRTPLNAILNFTAFVADGVMGDVNEEQEEALRQSITSGKHLLSLINDILDVTKIEAGLMDLFIQPVDLNEILGGVVGIGKGLSKDKPIQLITDIQDNLPTTYGDKRRLRQVFLNIISNAFKFTPQGDITINAHATETHLHVKVRDTGVGIPPEHQEMVFESFKQAQNDTLDTIGTGLGMPISKYFVESHKGRMWFESEVGKGTTFFVELPILTEAQANGLVASINASNGGTA